MLVTKLQELSSALLEAGWLLAVVIAVVFLNPFARQSFDPAKVFLFRSLALLLLALLIIRELEIHEHIGQVSGRVYRAVSQTPFVRVVLAWVLVNGVATLLSVSPRHSFWGSYLRAAGMYTLLSYFVLFVAVLRVLRRPDQLERLVNVLLVASFPVALYGVFQHFGITLLGFTDRIVVVTERAASTIGNAIFLGGYLVMVVPLTVSRLVGSLQDWLDDRGAASGSRIGVYSILLVLQLLCMLYTQSRGPLLALAVELFFMLFLIALLYGRRRLAWALIAGGVFAFLFLVALNVPALPLDSLRQLPYVSRFSRLPMELARGTFRKRSLAWESVLNAVAASPERAWFGFGPETMHLVFDQIVVSELVPLLEGWFFDRAHNTVFDTLFATGVVGMMVYLLLFGLIFYRACRWLGLAVTARERRLLAGLLLVGAGLGLLVAVLPRGDLVFVGIGVPAGMVGGLFLYLVNRFVRDTGSELPPQRNGTLLLIALLSAMVGHFVEGLTGLWIVSNRVHFWLYLALLILLGRRQVTTLNQATIERRITAERRNNHALRHRTRRANGDFAEWGTLTAVSLVVAVMLGCLIFAFVHGVSVPGAQGPALGLVAMTWGFSGLLLILEGRRASGLNVRRGAVVYVLTTLVWVLPFGLYYSAHIKAVEIFYRSLIFFVPWLFVTWVIAGVVWCWSQLRSPALKFTNNARAVAYPLIVASALVIAWVTNLTPMRADVHAKIGEVATDTGHWDLGFESLNRAIQLDPDRAQYYDLQGDTYLEWAQLASGDSATASVRLKQAQQALQRGWVLAPRDSTYPRKLGALYRTWARMFSEPAAQKARLEESLRYFIAAAELSPRSSSIRIQLAEMYLVLGYEAEALAEYQRVIDLNHPDYLAAAYAGKGDVYVAQGKLFNAVDAYGKALQAGSNSQELLEARRRIVEDNPDQADLRLRLALVYVGMGRRAQALEQLEIAVELTSGKERTAIEELIRDLEKQ